jgi:hypothetical protein
MLECCLCFLLVCRVCSAKNQNISKSSSHTLCNLLWTIYNMHAKDLERKKDSASFLYNEQRIKMVTNSISRLKTKIANFLWMRGENMNFVLYFLGKCRYYAVSDSAWWEWCRNLRSFACFSKIRLVFKGDSLRRNNPRGKRKLVQNITHRAEAKFLVHDWGDIVDSDISFRTGPPCRTLGWRGPVQEPMSESTISPSKGLRIWLQYQYLCGARTSSDSRV